MATSNHEFRPALSSIASDIGKNCRSDYGHSCLVVPVNVCSKHFQWRRYDSDLKRVDSKVTCYSQVHEVDCAGSTLVDAKTETHALEKPICVEEWSESACDCSAARLDLEALAVEELTHKLLLEKEINVLEAAFDPANHINITSLAGQELDSATPANPLDFIRLASVKSRHRFNVGVMNRCVKEYLRRNPSLFGNGCCDVLLSDEQLAAMLGLDEICCPDAYVDTAGLGLPPNIQQVLGNSILLIHRNNRFNSSDCGIKNFAFEARYQPQAVKNGGRSRGSSADGFRVYVKDNDWNMGAEGGCRVRVVTNYGLVFTDFSLAHLITDVLV